MDVEQARRVRQRACGSKRELGRDAARQIADGTDGMWAYRCPWSHKPDRHWHVGHVPSHDSLETVGQAVRVLAQQA